MSDYAPLALGIVGAFIGGMFGMPMVGFVAGEMLGAALFPGKGPDGPRLTDLKVQTSAYGQPIEILWGTVRKAGNVTWAQKGGMQEHAHEHGGKGSPSSTSYTYRLSFAVQFGEANVPWTAYKRLWFNKRLVWENGKSAGDPPLPVTFYLGGPDQLPDPTIEADKGVGNAPAYRLRGYIVFTDLDLTDVGNMIPQVEAEIQANGDVSTFGLEYYAVWDVDTDFNNVTGYSYPFLLNGQHYNQTTKKIVSYQYRSHEDYGPPADHNKGIYGYAEWSHNLDGTGLATVSHTTTPWPGAAFLGPPQGVGFPQSAPQIKGAMNDFIAYISSNVVGLWPDGTTIPKTHFVDGWMVGGTPAIASMIPAIALAMYPDGYNPPGANMWIRGTIIVSRDGGWIYAACGSSYLLPADDPGPCIRKYKINGGGPFGGPSRSFVAQFDIPVTRPAPYVPVGGTGIDICEGDDGFIYVLATIAFQNDSVMYKLDPKTLGIVYRWQNSIGTPRDGTQIDGTNAFVYTPGYSTFAVYKDYLIVYANTQGAVHLAPAFGLYKLNYVSGFIEYVGYLANPANGAHTAGNTTPVIYLGDGYCAVRDGILDLGGRDGGGVTLGYIVGDISTRVGQTAFDVSDLPDPVRGFAATRQGAARSTLEALMPAFFFGAVESDAVVKFKHYGKPSLGVIPDEDLGARQPNSAPVSLLTTVHDQEEQLPRAVYVKYPDFDAAYQDGAQLFRRQVTTSELEVTVDAPIVFTADEAKAIADRIGTNSWIEREHHTFYTPRKYAHYEPIDVVTIQGREMRITAKTEQQSGIIKWDAVASLEAIFIQAPPGIGGGYVPPTFLDPQLTDLRLLDIPLPTDESNANGYPAMMAGADRVDWRGAQLYKSSDGGASYQALTVGFVADTFGWTTTALADFADGNVFDESNVVTVALTPGSGALASATADAVLNGANEALIGNEIMQFKVATLTTPLTYDLSGLLRGRRGTEWATNSHVAGDPFQILPAQNNVAGSLAEVGMARKFKAVTMGSSLAGADAVDFTNTGRALQPYAPVNLGGGPNGAGDVTLTWIRRTRIGGLWRDLVDVKLGEATEDYIVQLWDSSYTLCATWFIVNALNDPAIANGPSITITAAIQTTLFGALQKHIYFTVGQLGAVSLGSQARGVALGLGGSDVAPLVPIAPYAFPVTIAPVPGPTRTPDHVFTVPESLILNPWKIGQIWSGQFTTPAGTPQGQIAVAEYQNVPVTHHCWISTDSGGVNKVAKSESWGTSATSRVGALGGGAILTGSTMYYFFFDFMQQDGTLAGPAGDPGNTIVNLIL